MDVYYNEFSTPKLCIQYDHNLPKLLSLSELDGGITSFSLYDSKYSSENITPFFRAKILDATFSKGQVVCILEWVSYTTLYFNPDIHFLSNILCDEAKIIFLFAYNQFVAETVKEKTNYIKTLLHPQQKWGKKVTVKDMPFMAAPIMFFGQRYYDIIPREILLKVTNSQKYIINGQEIIAIKLFELYDDPALHRDIQKRYWKITHLSRRIKIYEKKVCSVDAIKQYNDRHQTMKAQSRKK